MPITESSGDPCWIDSHCHLNDLAQPETEWAAAAAQGIRRCLIPGTHPAQWPQLYALATVDRQIALGTHPWFVREPEVETDALRTALVEGRARVIGEIGLDFYRGRQPRPDRDTQLGVFRRQLGLASEFKRPVILHAVKAHQEIITELKEAPDVTGVVHAFNGPYPLARQYLDQGFYLGIGPQLMRSGKLQETVRRMPAERILVETDAPHMTIARDREGPLLDLLTVAGRVAELRNVSLSEIQRQTSENTQRCFDQLW